MKRTLFALVFAVATLPAGFAQTQTQSSTEQTKEHSATTVNPDGSAVHSTAKSKESTESSTNADGTSRMTQNKQSRSKTKMKSPSTDQTTTEHHSSSSTDSTKTTTTPPQL